MHTAPTLGSVAFNVRYTYNYTDKKITPGSVYMFRLKMRDKDGHFTYSAAISVTYAAKTVTGFSVFPNPAVGSYLYVKPLSSGTPVQIAVMDLDGRTWYSGKLTPGNMSNGHFEIPVKLLPAGSYVLRLSDKTGERLHVTKFTIVK